MFKKVKLRDITSNDILIPYTEVSEILYEWVCDDKKCYTNSQIIYSGSFIFNELGNVITTYQKSYENGTWTIKHNNKKFTLSGNSILIGRNLESLLYRLQNFEHYRSNRFFNN